MEEVKKRGLEGRALDIGCGDGRFCFELAKMGFEVEGIDISKRALSFARIFVPNGRFLCEDITNPSKNFLAKNRDKFDLVLFIETLEHIVPSKHLKALKNTNILLKKGGLLIISVPSTLMPKPEKHFKHFSKREITKLLKKANFLIEKVEGGTRGSWSFLVKIADNRFYTIKPLKKLLLRYIEKRYHYQNCNLKKAERYIVYATKH